ncbi:MAG: oxidoreductase, partial [Paenibacillaceae bacterium]|nr:oxidoreductase [Paenibacillaceae bacterium]
MKQAQFAIIGGAGFRAQAYLRIARALPRHFRVTGLVVRQEEKGQAMEQEWGIPAYRTHEELLAQGRPDFIVVSAGKGAAAEILPDLAERGIPVGVAFSGKDALQKIPLQIFLLTPVDPLKLQ